MVYSLSKANGIRAGAVSSCQLAYVGIVPLWLSIFQPFVLGLVQGKTDNAKLNQKGPRSLFERGFLAENGL